MKVWPIMLLLIGSSRIVGAQAPATQAASSLVAPSWHVGQQWQVRVPLPQGLPMGGALRDLATEFTTYRFQVLGRRILRYEMQDGQACIGQSVPPEDCWLVSITPDRQEQAFSSCHLYFRADDLSLREVHLILGNGKGGYFVYSGTHVNEDDEAKPTVVVNRGPYHSSLEPAVIDWPCFPLTDGSDAEKKKALADDPVTQTVTPVSLGVRVVIRRGRETTTQTWLPGDPWWRFAERGGLRKSWLVRGEQQSSHQVK